MNYHSDEEIKQQFESTTYQLKDTFPIVVEHYKRELRKQVFAMDAEAFAAAKIKVEFLDEILNKINNSYTRGNE